MNITEYDHERRSPVASTRVDLNCDMGESFGAYEIWVSPEVLDRISSANVACGFHAGDPVVMAETVALCKQHGVAVGAHPGLPDLMGFGRREMKVSQAEASNYVVYQVGALQAFCNAAGLALQHVKPHGALYNMAASDENVARAIIEGLLRLPGPRPAVLALCGSKFAAVAREAGLRVHEEAFADRAYNRDGTLVSRRQEGAVIEEPDLIAHRALRMVKDGIVETVDGDIVNLSPDSLCVHGDNPHAQQIVKRLAEVFREGGVEVAPLGELA